MALNYQGEDVKRVKFNAQDVQKIQVRENASSEYTTIYEIVTKTNNFLLSGTTGQLTVVDPETGDNIYITPTLSQPISDTSGEVLEVISAVALESSKIYSGPTVEGSAVKVVLKNSKASTRVITQLSVTYKLAQTKF